MTDVQLLRSDLISSDDGRVFEALTLLRESVRAVLAQTADHPLDSLFAKYYAASPEFSELIVAWDSQSSKETKISLLCVHVLIDSFKCSDIMGEKSSACASKLLRRKGKWFSRLIGGKPKLACLVLRLLSTLVAISGSVARDCVLHFALDAKPMLDILARKPKELPDGGSKRSSQDCRSASIELVSALLTSGNSFVLNHVSQIKGLLVTPLKHMLLDSDRVAAGYLSALYSFSTSHDIADAARVKIMSHPAMISRLRAFISQGVSEEVYRSAWRLISALFIEADALILLKDAVPCIANPSFLVRNACFKTFVTGMPLDDHRVSDFLRACCSNNPELQLLIFKSLHYSSTPRSTPAWTKATISVLQLMLIEPSICLLSAPSAISDADEVSSMIVDWILPSTFQISFFKSCLCSDLAMIVNLALEVICAALLRLRWCVASLPSAQESIAQRIRSVVQHRIPDLNGFVGIIMKARAVISPLSKVTASGPQWSTAASECIMCRTVQLLKYYVMLLPSAAIESKFDVTKLCIESVTLVRASDSSMSDIRNAIVCELFALFNSSPPGVQRSSLDHEKRFIEHAAAHISLYNSSSLSVSAHISVHHFLVSNQLILLGLEGRAQCFIVLSLLSSDSVHFFMQLVQEALSIRSASMTVNADAVEENWLPPISKAVASLCASHKGISYYDSVMVGFMASSFQTSRSVRSFDKKLMNGRNIHPALLLSVAASIDYVDSNFHQTILDLAVVEKFHIACNAPGCHEYMFLACLESLQQLVEHKMQVDLSSVLSSLFDIICRCLKSSISIIRLDICSRIRDKLFPMLLLAIQRKNAARSNVSIFLVSIVNIALCSRLSTDADVMLSSLIQQLTAARQISPVLVDCCHAFSQLLMSVPASSSLDLVIVSLIHRVQSSDDSFEQLLQCISSVLRMCSQSHIHHLECGTLVSFVTTMFTILKQPKLCRLHLSSIVRPISLVLQRFVSPLDFASLSQGFRHMGLTIDDAAMNTLLDLEQYNHCHSQILRIVRYVCMSSLPCLQFFVDKMLNSSSPSSWWLSKPVLCVFFDVTRYLQHAEDSSSASVQLLSSLSDLVEISKSIIFADDFSETVSKDAFSEFVDEYALDRILCRQLLEMGIQPRVSTSCISMLLENCVSAPPSCLEQSISGIMKSYVVALELDSDAELQKLEHQASQVFRICYAQSSGTKESIAGSLHVFITGLAKLLSSRPYLRIPSLSLLCDMVEFCSPIPVPASRLIANCILSSQSFLDILEAHDGRTHYTFKCLRLLADKDTGIATQQLLQHALFAFTCSLSETDNEIRRIIAHCDANGFKLAAEGYSWGTSRSSHSGWDWIFTGQFDSKRVMSCAQSSPACFDASVAHWNRDLSSVYDAGFILAMVEVGIRELNDIKTIPQLIDSGILTLSIKMTASADEKIRACAYNVLALVLSLFESPSAAAYPQMAIDYSQIQMLLSCLKNSITAPLQQLPNLFAAMIAESVIILGRPGHPLFETFTRLLLRSPILDVTDLNWVSVVLGNDGVEFKAHMMWALRVLKHGIVGEGDVACLRRRRLIAAICNLYDSRACDNIMRSSIRDVLFNVASHRLGATYLIDHCGIFPWCVSLLPTCMQNHFSVVELRSSHLQRGEQELRFSLRLANRCSQSCVRFGRAALLIECSVLLLSSFSVIFVAQSESFSAVKSTAKSWLQLAAFVLKAKRSGLKGGGDMPVFINVEQLHTLLAFAHRARFIHGDSEFEELVLTMTCHLPSSWISASKWAERSDSLAELLSWLLHSCWKTQSGVTARCNSVILIATWSSSQAPIVKDSISYLLLNMLVAIWRWLTPDQREMIKKDCPLMSTLSVPAPSTQGSNGVELSGNRKRVAATDHTLLSSLPTKNPKL
jgi:hypothetical protein